MRPWKWVAAEIYEQLSQRTSEWAFTKVMGKLLKKYPGKSSLERFHMFDKRLSAYHSLPITSSKALSRSLTRAASII